MDRQEKSYAPEMFRKLSENVKFGVTVLLSVLVVFLMITMFTTSGFSNTPTAIRRYVVADEGMSLDDKLHRNTRSGLTGSRDVPVFFSDFNVEMTRDANGDLVPVRESFTNEKATDVSNIEERFLVN